MWSFNRFGLILVLLCLHTPAWAATRYVHPTGNGSPPCTQGSPCPLLTGINALQSGDTLLLQAGTYTPAVQGNCPSIKTNTNISNTPWTLAQGTTVQWNGYIESGGQFGGTNINNFTIDGSPGTLTFHGQNCGGMASAVESITNSRFEGFRITHAVHGIQGGYDQTLFRRIKMDWIGRDENSPYLHKK